MTLFLSLMLAAFDPTFPAPPKDVDEVRGRMLLCFVCDGMTPQEVEAVLGKPDLEGEPEAFSEDCW